MIVALLMVGMTIFAQERNRRQGNDMERFTPEQRSQLQLKKMTLNLDLNESQQREIKAFIADKNTKMEAHKTAIKAMKEKGMKPSNDERFTMKMKMLDEQIATKKRMEKILNPKQFEKWIASHEGHKRNQKENHQGKQQRKG